MGLLILYLIEGQYRSLSLIVDSPVEMQDGKDCSIGDRVQELVSVPTGSQRSSLTLTITNNGESDEVGMVEDGTKGMGEGVSQLTTLVKGSGRLGGCVRADSAWERELSEELSHTVDGLGDAGVDLGVDTLEEGLGEYSRCTVA